MSHLTPNNLMQIDQLIRMKATGNPAQLANRIGVSERSLYDMLDWLKKDLDCPIAYSKLRKTYYYKESGRIVCGFKADD